MIKSQCAYAPKYPHVAGIYPTTSKTWQKNHDRFSRHVDKRALTIYLVLPSFYPSLVAIL